MGSEQKKSKRTGFTFIEVLAAVAIGSVVLAALFVGLNAAMSQASLASRRAEMQQNVRAAMNNITRELELAGTNYPTTNVALPPNLSGANAPRFGVDIKGTAYNQHYFGDILANNNAGSVVLFSLSPEHVFGPIDMTGNNSDSVTLVYADPNFPPLNITVGNITSNGTVATFTIGAAPNPTPAAKYLDDPVVGMQPGDLMLFSGTAGHAVVEVTSLGPAGTANVADFATNDVLRFNADVGGGKTTLGALVASLPGTTNFTATKLDMVSYFLYQLQNTSGTYLSLMRQLNARTPAPVADNVSMLQFTYDTFDGTNGITTSNDPNADTTAGTDSTSSPPQIRKVNVWVGTRSLRAYHAGPLYDNMTLGSTISPRNLDYINRY